jgi:RHS repeat-associated protein
MSNFDVSLGISGNSASVLLFGGKVVNFTTNGNTWQLTSPLDIVYQLATSGSGYKFMDPVSRLIYTFSSSGTLTRVEDRKGNALTVTPGTFGPTSISDGAGRTLTLTYSAGQLSTVADQGGRTFSYAHNGTLLTSSTDDANKVTKYAYTPSGGIPGLLLSKQLPLGNTPTTQVYDINGRVISQTDGNKNVTTISYDGSGGTTVTNPVQAVKKQTSDSNGDLTAQTDPAGAMKIGFDSANRRTSVTDRSGNTTSISYHPATGYLASVTDPLGNTTSYSYTAQVQDVFTFYNQTGVTHADGSSESYSYDSNGNALSHKAQDGSTTSFTYDASGRPLTVTYPNNGVTTYTWNADSTVATDTDPAGNTTTFGYDVLKRLTKITDPNGGVSTSSSIYAGDGSRLIFGSPAGTGGSTLYYDFNGQPQDFVNDFGGVYHSDYTATDNLAAITDPLGKKTSWTYNTADQVASVTDPAGVAVSYAYDSAGRVTSIANGSGALATFAYTAEGRVASTTDATGNKTSFSYDADGRESGVTFANGAKVSYAFDKLGNLISTTDPLGGVRSFTLDKMGRFTDVSAPGGLTTSVTRDAVGNPTTLTTANGNKWTSQYDASGRLVGLTDPLGNAITYTYTGTQLTAMTSALGTVALTVDKAGHVTKRTYSDGTVINAGYDSGGHLISADNLTIKRDSKSQPTNINGIGITYDAAGRPATLVYASGKSVAYTYDSSGRTKTVTDWVGGKTSLTYDAAGRLTSLAYPNGATTTYSYDTNGLPIKIGFGSLGSITLTRDAGGKIIVADRSVALAPSTASIAPQGFGYDAAGQLANAAYDTLGRVTTQAGRTYTWNLASQLTSFLDGSNAASFTYDGLGGINTMTTGSTTRSFVINYVLPYPALSIVRQGGSDLHYYVYLPDGRLLYSVEADNTRHFFHFDEMGNTVMLTDAVGAVSDGYALTPYGEISAHSGTADNPFTWQGQFGVFQEGTALFNMRTRHYDASSARFLSRDPVISADPRSSEPYGYANGNPLLFTDPFGTASTSNKCMPSASEIASVFLAGVQSLTPLQVYSFLSCEVSNGYINTDNFGLQIWLGEFSASVQNNKSVSWKGVATDFQLANNDPAPIFTFLNAEIQTALSKSKTDTKAVQAVLTQVAKTPVRTVLSLLDTAKPTPAAPPAPTPAAPSTPAATTPAGMTQAQYAALCAKISPNRINTCLEGFQISQALNGLTDSLRKLF